MGARAIFAWLRQAQPLPYSADAHRAGIVVAALASAMSVDALPSLCYTLDRSRDPIYRVPVVLTPNWLIYRTNNPGG